MVVCPLATKGELVQHLDATVISSVVGDPVVAWVDQSGNLNDAIQNRGDVRFPSTSLFATGLPGLDFGLSRNDMQLMDAAGASALLDFSGAAAGKGGFTIVVAFKVDEITGTNQYIMGVRQLLEHFSIRVNTAGMVAMKLNGNLQAVGSEAIVAGDSIVVTATYDATTGEYTLWDSKNQTTSSGTQMIAGNYGNGFPLILGESRITSTSTEHLRGLIGEVKIYDSVLTVTELLSEQAIMVEKWVESGDGSGAPVDPGPGFPNVSAVEGQLLGEAWTDPSDNGARTVVMDYLNGYLYMDTRDLTTGGSNHSLQAWDVSDPTNPTEVVRLEGDRGQHTAFLLLPHHRVNADGNRFLNVRDPLNMFYETPLGYLPLDLGTRHATVLPYQYSGGSTIEIHNARTGEMAAISEHGFEGQSTPIGNLLIVAGLRGQTRRIATYDISDPFNPFLLNILDLSAVTPEDPDFNPAYEPFVWKHFLVLPNVLNGGDGDDMAFVDFSDPTNLRHVLYTNGDGTFATGLPGRTRYAQFQDNYMFLGGGKYDMSPLENDNEPILVQTFLEQNGEYMLPLGNLLLSAENSNQGEIPDSSGGPFPFRIFAHQSAPDTNPPSVAYHIPQGGDVNQHVLSRVGVVIHETLDYATVNDTTFRVFPSRGGADLSGTLNAHDKDILTFTPDLPLAEGTEYTVLLDGIADAAGNAMSAYSFTFTTAGEGSTPPLFIDEITYAGYPALVGTPTPFSVSTSGGDGNLEYRWNFGDGTVSDWAPGNPTPVHSFSTTGHFVVQAQVRDGSGQQRTATITATAAEPIPGALPTKGSQIIQDEVRDLVWTVFPDNNRVVAIGTISLQIEHNVYLGASADPRSLAQDGFGNIWVTALDGDRIDIIQVNGGGASVVESLLVQPGSRPNDIVIDPTKTYAYVSLKGSGQILQIEIATRQMTFVTATATPTALALNASGDELLVNRFISSDASGEVHALNVGESISLNQMIQLAKDTVSDDSGDSGRGLPNYLADVAISPNGNFAYVSAKKDNIDRGLMRDGQALTFETTTRAIVAKIDLATKSEDFNARIDIDDSSQPTALALSPYGDYLFVAMQGNNHIQIIDTFNNQPIATIPSGFAPQGIYIDPSTLTMYVKNLNSVSVSIYDISDFLLVGMTNIPLLQEVVLGSDSMEPQVRMGKRIFYDASDPRMSADGYISCALCHQDGDHDGRVWDFTDRGEGFRNTTNLRGRAGMAHGRVHWSANFDEIQDFEHDIQGPFGGTGFMEGEDAPLGTPKAGVSLDLDALAAYVSSLSTSQIEKSPFRESDGSLTDEAQSGRELFRASTVGVNGQALACASCHNPDTEFTDSNLGVLHNVGTIRGTSGERLGGGPGSLAGIDTPTLLGVHASAPFFHDGAAATLSAVFDPSRAGANPGEVGNVHDLNATGYNLTASEKASLLAYLLQLDGIPINEPPQFLSDPISKVNAVESLAYSGSIAGDAMDAEGNTMTFTKVSGPAWLTVDSDGTLGGTPTAGDIGSNEFLVQVDAIGGSDTATVLITIDAYVPPNEAPLFSSDPINEISATEDLPYMGTIGDDASDPEGDVMSFSKVSGPAWLVVASDGSLSGTPTNDDVGLNVFSVRVEAEGGFDTAGLNITVNNVNDLPVFTFDPISAVEATELEAYSATIAGSASDQDLGDVLTYSKVAGPTWLTVAADGTLSGTPDSVDLGANSFTVSVSDGNGGSDSATLNINVVEAPAAVMYVSSIQVNRVNLGKGNSAAEAIVTISDAFGAPVPGAVVEVSFTEAIVETVTAVTDANGVATLPTAGSANNPARTTGCVSNVSSAAHEYNPALNVSTCGRNY